VQRKKPPKCFASTASRLVVFSATLGYCLLGILCLSVSLIIIMENYTNSEMTDMVLCYGSADGVAKNFRRVVFRIRKHFWLLSTGKWYFSTPLRSPVVPVEGERPLFFYTPAMKFQWMVDPHLRVEWTQLLLGFRLIWRRFSECYLPSAKFLWPRG
jgi:hypothetical protein